MNDVSIEEFVDKDIENVEVDGGVVNSDAATDDEVATEVEAEVKAAAGIKTDVKTETENTEESFLLPATEDTETGDIAERHVPIHVVQELRQKNRELKEALKSKNEAPPDKSLDDVLKELDGMDEDDVVDKATLTKIVKGAVDVAVSRVKQDVNSEKETESRQAFFERCRVSETAIRKESPDYKEVMTTVRELNLLNDDDRHRAMNTTHPAKALYLIAKDKLNKISKLANSTTMKTETNGKPAVNKNITQDDILKDDDDEFYDKEFNS